MFIIRKCIIETHPDFPKRDKVSDPELAFAIHTDMAIIGMEAFMLSLRHPMSTEFPLPFSC